MGIVSQSRTWGKGLAVAVQGRTRGDGGAASEGRGGHDRGQRAAGRVGDGPLHSSATCGVGPKQKRERHGAQEADDVQATLAAHRAPREIHPRQPEHESGHRLGGQGSRRGRRGEEFPAPRQLGRAPPGWPGARSGGGPPSCPARHARETGTETPPPGEPSSSPGGRAHRLCTGSARSPRRD